MAWLSDWEYRLKLEIDYTKIDAALTNFPVLLRIGDSSGITNEDLSSLYNNIISERKFAVTASDGTTQCYVEVLNDDPAELGVFCLWVLVPSISNSANTVLYIYWDSAKPEQTEYIGFKSEKPAEKVWDANFGVVFHMDEQSIGASQKIYSSARWWIRGTTGNSTNYAPDPATGLIYTGHDYERDTTADRTEFSKHYNDTDVSAIQDDSANDFVPVNVYVSGGCYPDVSLGFSSKFGGGSAVGSSSSYWRYTDNSLFTPSGDFTFEFWVRFTTLPTSGNSSMFFGHGSGATDEYKLRLRNSSGTYYLEFLETVSSVENINHSVAFGTITTGVWYHVAMSRSGNDFRYYKDGNQIGSTQTYSSAIANQASYLYMGRAGSGDTGLKYMEEFRFSNVARYTGATYTVQDHPWVRDANTVMLLHLHPATPSFRNRSYGTVEALVKLESTTAGEDHEIFYEATNGGISYPRVRLYFDPSRYLKCDHMDSDTGTVRTLTSSSTYSLGTWYHVAFTFNAANDDRILYVNGAVVASDLSTAIAKCTDTYSYSIQIGYAGLDPDKLDGVLEEFRISWTDRSGAWIKATYHTCFDTLITFDAFEDAEQLPTCYPGAVYPVFTVFQPTNEVAAYHYQALAFFGSRAPRLSLGASKNPEGSIGSRATRLSTGVSKNPGMSASARRPKINATGFSGT